MKKAIFIINKKSGNQTVSNRLSYIIEEFLKNDIIIEPYFLFVSKKFDKFIPDKIKEEKYDYIFLSGGDGTINLVVNVLMENNIKTPIGIYPGGTANDFANTLGMNKNIEKWIENILNGKTKRIDILNLDDKHYFVGSLAGGLFTDISYNTPNIIKQNIGPLAYYVNVLNEVARKKSFSISIETEKEYLEKEVLMFIVLNGTGVGGFENLLSDGDLTDSMMDIILIHNATSVVLANLLLKVMNNTFIDDPHITRIKCRECFINSVKRIKVSVDGESGPKIPIKIKVERKAIEVFID